MFTNLFKRKQYLKEIDECFKIFTMCDAIEAKKKAKVFLANNQDFLDNNVELRNKLESICKSK